MQSPQSSSSGAAANMPLVTVQILHWRGLDKTRECLRSVLAIQYPNLHVLLVDNGSDGGDHKILKEEFGTTKNFEILALDQNYGFAGGSNRGLEHAIKGGAEFVWLLNNDATVRPETLMSLIEVAIANPGAGALGALVVEGAEPQEAGAEVGVGAINFLKAKTYLQKLPNLQAQGVSTFHRCEWLSGSNLLLRSAALDKVGFFDERYYLYFEDVDLCLRLTRAGYACLLVPGSIVRHEGNASTQGGLSLWRAYYHTRNRLLFFMQNTPPASRFVALVAIFAHFLRHCVSLPLKGRAGRAKLHAEWLGLRDYFAGRVGRAACLDWCETIKL
ncbi:MAG: glycosyltransferase family 2 protein [Cyanobacteria bacterium SZAS LIN-3]|nr:glycosyltransferase family 2 protein [Cyanobacteria bacterium SZAS LIN-3]